MKYPLYKMNKAVLGAALSLTIALSAGTLLAGGHSAHAAAGVVQAQAADSSASSIADEVIAAGKKFMGVRYLYGAESNRTDAFDCSSFTQYIFKQSGIELPRSSKQQSQAGVYVARSQLQPGDLIFSDTNRDGEINHVSLYIGDGKLLHTYRVGIGVTISDFEGSTWDKTYVTARRVIPTNASTGGGQSQTDNPSRTGDQSQTGGQSQTDNGSSAGGTETSNESGGQSGNGRWSDNGGDRGDRFTDRHPSSFFGRNVR
ncbi:C40 family peptidase [Cohnella cellulosilytica]|uniref:C40 family peptidase n=1 Tax=Cohnella cellulosilytica TaxID=986710 RepID=A0ABW2F3K1_9BACL